MRVKAGPSRFVVHSVFAVLWAAGGAAAQETAPLQGVVAEENTGRLIAAAKVTLVGTTTEVRADSDGVFEFPAVPVGTAFIRVQAEGYPAVVEQVSVTRDGIVFIPVLLPTAVATIEELRVLGNRGAPNRSTAATAADLLALQIPGITTLATLSDRRNNPVRLGVRGRGSLSISNEPAIIVDGVQMSGGDRNVMEVLRQIPATQVKAIRVLTSLSAGFIYGAADGVIVIETVGH